MTPTLSVRLDFSRELVKDDRGAKHVADILSRPSFSALERVSGRQKDRWAKHVKKSSELIEQYVTDAAHDAISLDTKRGPELVASAEIETGLRGRATSPTALIGYVVMPLDGTNFAIEAISRRSQATGSVIGCGRANSTI